MAANYSVGLSNRFDVLFMDDNNSNFGFGVANKKLAATTTKTNQKKPQQQQQQQQQHPQTQTQQQQKQEKKKQQPPSSPQPSDKSSSSQSKNSNKTSRGSAPTGAIRQNLDNGGAPAPAPSTAGTARIVSDGGGSSSGGRGRGRGFSRGGTFEGRGRGGERPSFPQSSLQTDINSASPHFTPTVAGDRPYKPRGERPFVSRDDRPPRGEDRPPRGEDRPPRGEDRPPRGEDRPPRGEDRPPRGEDRPRRSDGNNIQRTERLREDKGFVQPQKRIYDRHSGTGRSINENKKAGSGKGSWGKPGSEIEELSTPAQQEDQPTEEGGEVAPESTPTDAPAPSVAETSAKQESVELSLSEYYDKLNAQKAEVDLPKPRAAGEGVDQSEWSNFQKISRQEQAEAEAYFPTADKKKKTKTDADQPLETSGKGAKKYPNTTSSPVSFMYPQREVPEVRERRGGARGFKNGKSEEANNTNKSTEDFNFNFKDDRVFPVLA